MLPVIADLIFWAWMLWSWSFLFWLYRGKDKDSSLYRFLAETKQAFKVLLVAKIGFYDPWEFMIDDPLPGGSIWLSIVWLCDLLWFVWIKDVDDDDRWKKRRKKAAAKVKEMAGRLVVVPEPIPVTGK